MKLFFHRMRVIKGQLSLRIKNVSPTTHRILIMSQLCNSPSSTGYPVNWHWCIPIKSLRTGQNLSSRALPSSKFWLRRCTTILDLMDRCQGDHQGCLRQMLNILFTDINKRKQESRILWIDYEIRIETTLIRVRSTLGTNLNRIM